MKKKNYIILVLTIIAMLSFTANMYASQDSFSFNTPSNQQEKEFHAQLSKEIQDFRQKVNKDIQKSFGLNLDQYTEVSLEKILEEQANQSLASIYVDLCIQQSEGDIKPSLFISKDNNKAYILEKKADGTNHVYQLKKKKDSWEIESKEKKKGIYIQPIE